MSAIFFPDPLLFTTLLLLLSVSSPASFLCSLSCFLYCLASMDLDSSGFSGTTFLDGRHLTTDIPHTPTLNASHGQLFSQNTSLLMGCTHDMHMTSDSSPLVSALIICISKMSGYFFFCQSMLSPSLDLWLSCVSDEELLASGNTAYLQSQLVVERQQWKIGKMDNQIRGLETEVTMWKTQFMSTQ